MGYSGTVGNLIYWKNQKLKSRDTVPLSKKKTWKIALPLPILYQNKKYSKSVYSILDKTLSHATVPLVA
jgi:hypothetical protein